MAINKKKIILIILFTVIILFGIFIASLFLNQPNIVNDNEECDEPIEIIYSIYPNTTAPPTLHFYWDDPHINTTVTAYDTGGFGSWQGGGRAFFIWNSEPAESIGMKLNYTQPQRLYSSCSGTITDIRHSEQLDDWTVSVRYGRNYVVEYRHVINVNETLDIGDLVEEGDHIAFSLNITPNVEIYLEFALIKVNETSANIIPIIEYYDGPSNDTFENIRKNAGEIDSWTIKPDLVRGYDNITQGFSWIDEMGMVAWPDVPRLIWGYNCSCGMPDYEKVIEEILLEREMEWILSKYN